MTAVHANVLAQLRAPQKYHTRPLVLDIQPGHEGTMQTLAAMQAVTDDAQASPLVHRTAAAIVASVPNRDYPAQLLAVDQFIRAAFHFKPDSWNREDVRHPDQLLQEIAAAASGRTACDCDDIAVLGASLIRAIGRPAFFCACCRTPGGPYVHVHFGMVLQGSGHEPRYIPLDPQERIRIGQWTSKPGCRLIVPAHRT